MQVIALVCFVRLVVFSSNSVKKGVFHQYISQRRKKKQEKKKKESLSLGG
jgi:hypothetical protein